MEDFASVGDAAERSRSRTPPHELGPPSQLLGHWREEARNGISHHVFVENGRWKCRKRGGKPGSKDFFNLIWDPQRRVMLWGHKGHYYCELGDCRDLDSVTWYH